MSAMYATVDVNRTAITPLAVFGVHVSAATEIAMATANIAQVSITLAWITNNYIHDLSSSKWKKTLAYLLVLPGSRARIVRCGGRYNPQLVKRSSE